MVEAVTVWLELQQHLNGAALYVYREHFVDKALIRAKRLPGHIRPVIG